MIFLEPLSKRIFVARPSEKFEGKEADEKGPEAWQRHVEGLFGAMTPPSAFAARRSRKGFSR